MTNKVLSVSIAAYNVQGYIDQALNSIIECPLAEDIEAIVVNDGSSDRTLEIATGYATRYPSIINVIDKENGGYGSTINASIKVAAGTYFRLLDGDDWFDSDELAKLVDFLKKTDADVVVTKYRSVRGADERLVKLDQVYDGQTYPIENHLDGQYSQAMLVFRTSRLKDVLVEHPITEHANYTDMEFVLKGVAAMRSISYLDSEVYQYRLGREGQSVELRSWFSHIDIACKIAAIMSKYYEENIRPLGAISQGVKDWACKWCVDNASYKCKLITMMGVGGASMSNLKHYLELLHDSSPAVFKGVMEKRPHDRYALENDALRYTLSALPSRLFAIIQSIRGR